MLSRSGTLPRVQVEAQKRYVPEHLTEDAVISHAVWSELTAESVLALLDRELARFGFNRSDVFDDVAHAAHWADPLADPADIACHHTLSATNDAFNTAFTLLPEPERKMILLPTTSPFFTWNRISEALGDEPGYVAVAGFKPQMLAAAELKVLSSAAAKAERLPPPVLPASEHLAGPAIQRIAVSQ